MSPFWNKHTILGLLLGFVGVASFSLTLPMTRLAISAIDVETVAVWRGLIAAMAAAALLLVFYRTWPGASRIGPLLVTGGGIAIGFPVFATLAMQTVPASHGAIVVGLLPISTAIVGVVAANERPSAMFWTVSALGTIAILTFIFRQGESDLGYGYAYLMAAVLSAAIGYATGGNLAKEMGGPQVICWALVLTAPFLALATFFVAPVPWNAPTVPTLAFAYLALVSQLTAFFPWYAGLAIGGVAKVSQVQLLQIFMTLIASNLILSEPLGTEIWFFAGLVMACVLISVRLRVGARPNSVGQ